MKHIFGVFVVTIALAWPGLGLGQEYTFGKDSNTYGTYSGVSSGSSGKNGFYLAPRFLDSLTNTGEINGSGGRASRTCNTVGGAIAAGFYLNRLDSRIPLRTEVEYAARGDVRASWDRSIDTGMRQFKALFNVQTLQANVYWDIDTGTAFKPFIGGGLGLSFIYADYMPEGRGSYSDSTTGFAWNAGAGVAYDINESITVDLAYRFAGFGHAEARTPNSTTRNYMTANEFLLGLRLHF
ncbi:MAG: outer membrane beta-barrel protein [Deltaproteobacteria bacterium]|jgi:opacity protein-like surface antigen|nr:outer membrane beta-barrel protein [Deltaproteobacteria bacterium]